LAAYLRKVCQPSKLMAHMLELCPRGQEKNEFFLFLFLQRLLRELWVLQGEEPPAAPVAAVQGGSQRSQAARGRGTAQRCRGGHGSSNGGGGGQRAATPSAFANTPGTLARFATGICHFHWTYGDKATKCESPCSWGN
jgi:hypothetical protein